MLIDTHAHIYLPELAPELDGMLQRAENAGVGTILMPAIDSSTHRQMLALEQERPGICLSMMGVHPCYIKENYKEELAIARTYLESRPFKAVGEIGLDFYWDKTFTEQQYVAFNEQIEWALHYNIPIVIHSRESTDECINIVSEHQKGSLRGVFHCFSGNAEQAQKVIELGFYLGIGGVVTFKNSGLDKVMDNISLDQVVLETDTPYLAPVPFRGKRNEPSYLQYVTEKLSLIKGLPAEEIARITTANAIQLFELGMPS